MKRASLVLMMVSLLAVSPVLAGGSGEQQEMAADEPQQEVTLEIIWMGWPEDQVEPIMSMFEEAHPNISLSYERVPFTELFQTLDVRLQARSSTPDVYIVDGPLTASYAVRGHLAELTPVYGDELDGFTQAAIDQGTYDGKLYSAPFASSSQLMFYNVDLFESAGVDTPSADPAERWTWSEVVEAARQVADPDNDLWGFILEQTARPYQLLPLPQSKGAEVISPDGLTATGYVDSPEFVEAFEFYQDLFQEWEVSPVGTDIGTVPEIFGAGRAAMFIGGPWNLARFRNDFPDINWAVAPHPYFEGGEPVTPTGSWHIGINPRSEHMPAAETFVRYLTTNTDLRLEWFDLRGYVPVRNEIFDVGPDEVFQSDAWQIMLHEANNTAVPRPATPGYREYENILMQAFRDIQVGSDVQSRLESAAQEIDSSLSKYEE